jgi:hypothetical protein
MLDAHLADFGTFENMSMKAFSTNTRLSNAALTMQA